MRILSFAIAAAFLLASGAVMACPMETASKNQSTVASSNGNSTPIPKASSAGNS